MAKRIQRRRAKDWRMPKGAVYVGRPTKWGNPFEVGKDGDRDRCVELYAMLAGGRLCLSKGAASVDKQKQVFAAMADASQELRGKDLACWCPLDKWCHADVLLAIANALEVKR
jgi:hypothetical protein